MKYRLIEKTEVEEFAQELSFVYDIGSAGCDSVSVGCDITLATPDTETFTDDDVDIVDDTVTVAAHGYKVGLKVQLTTTDTLPTGLSLSTDYFIIVVDVNTIKFATSLANANAGTAVNITNAGPGGTTNTITATALAGSNVILQQSNDNENWINIGSAQNITETVFLWLEKDRPSGKYVRVKTTLTAGQLSGSYSVLCKGDRDL